MNLFFKKKSSSWRKRLKTHVQPTTYNISQVDKQFFFLILGLVVFGIVMVYNSSVVNAFQEFNDKFHFAKLQAIWATLGVAVMLVTAKIPYQWWRKYAVPLIYFTLGLLVLVLIPGVSREIYGARRWLSLGELTLQPSELAKFSLVIYLATTLSSPSTTAKTHYSRSIIATKLNRLPRLFWLTAGILGLIVLEPDLGTTIVLSGTVLAIYWMSGAPKKHFATLIGGGILAVLGLIMASPYRAARLKTFFDPTQDPLGTSYHIRQVLLALGSGGWTGLGLGQSRQKYAYLPEVSTDSIFAVIGEEIGFLGSTLVVLIFSILILKGLRIANRCPDQFGKLLAVGMISWVGLQAIINFFAMVVLTPLTGVPLPFISYGGSSLVVALASMGIVLNVSKHT